MAYLVWILPRGEHGPFILNNQLERYSVTEVN